MIESKSAAVRTLLLYAQDGKGMGHITRTLTIARHLVEAFPKAVAYIATESPVIREFTLPERCDYVKLPVRLSSERPEAAGVEEEEETSRFRQIRSRMLREAAVGLVPDLVLVDHEPLGHKGEFREGLWALKARCPETKFFFGLRDIMDDADRIRREWSELGVYDALERLYDGIAVYGSRGLYDVAQAYNLPRPVQSKLQYCGYIVREPPDFGRDAIRRQYRLPRRGPLVVATVGGGSDGYPVLEATQAAVSRLQARHLGLNAILVTGPFMPPEHQAILGARATSGSRVVARADNFQLMEAADAIVSMGGYNSVCEALVAAKPLVIIPRATHKIEQQIRAETLAAHGLARWVHPKELDGGALVEALEWALGRDPRAHARLVREIIPSFDGAARLTQFLRGWLDGRAIRVPHPIQEPSSVEQPA